MKIIIKQHALLKNKIKKTKKDWSNITIGSLTMLNEIKKNKKTIFYTKKTRLLNKKNGITLYVEKNLTLDNTNEITISKKKYTNLWLNRIVKAKKIEFKALIIKKGIPMCPNLFRLVLLQVLLKKTIKI